MMKNFKSKVLLFVISLFVSQKLVSAVLSQTLIKTPRGSSDVQYLKAGSSVIACNFDAQTCEEFFVETEIADIVSSVTDVAVRLETETGVILSPSNQYFFDPVHGAWIPAQNLTAENVLFSDTFEAVSIVHVEEVPVVQLPVYDVMLVAYHTFFISDGCNFVLVHNEPITASIGLGAAGVAAAAGVGTFLAARYALQKDSKIPDGSVQNFPHLTLTSPHDYAGSCDHPDNPYARNCNILFTADEQSFQISRARYRRQSDMQEKARIFSNRQQACCYLNQHGLTIEQACEYDRFLLTFPCVVELMLESTAGRQWFINEYTKITRDKKYRNKTKYVDGFIYEGGALKWLKWKFFGKDQQHYKSGYHNRITEIFWHIKEENAQGEQQPTQEVSQEENCGEQDVEKDDTLTNIDKLDENKIKHIIEGSKGKNHKWEKVAPKKNWEEIKKIIKDVMESGETKPYGSAQMKTKKIKGEIVEVTYASKNGVRNISNGWVK